MDEHRKLLTMMKTWTVYCDLRNVSPPGNVNRIIFCYLLPLLTSVITWGAPGKFLGLLIFSFSNFHFFFVIDLTFLQFFKTFFKWVLRAAFSVLGTHPSNIVVNIPFLIEKRRHFIQYWLDGCVWWGRKSVYGWRQETMNRFTSFSSSVSIPIYLLFF